MSLAPRQVVVKMADHRAGGTREGLSKPRGLLLDLDGTLVDTVPIRLAAWRQALTEADLPVTDQDLAGLIGIDGRRLVVEAAAMHNRTVDATRTEQIDIRAGEIYDALNTDPRPLPGLERLLGAANRHRIQWAIATSSRRENAAGSLAALRLPTARVFDGAHVQHAKPDPELLLLAADGIGLPPRDCWAIGDAVWDVLAATAAGMPAISVLAGSAATRGTLEDAGAAVVVADLGAVAELIDRQFPDDGG